MKSAITAFFAVFCYAGAASAQVTISIDTSLADQTLSLLCSGQPVDEAAIRASPLVQAQVQHNSGLIDAATMDAYVAALRGASACQAPTQDPFRIGDVIANRERYRRKIDAITARQQELASVVTARLTPYMPPGATFTGSVVIAVPYFSCGGFSARGAFFVDVRCLDDDINNDFNALAFLIAHETYHAIQARYFFQSIDDEENIHTANNAVEAILAPLVLEGSAQYVAPPSALAQTGGGPFTRLNRREFDTNNRRMRQNFLLMSMLIEQVARARNPRQAAEDAYAIGFSGSSYDQMGYYVGARMAGDIEAAWGRRALVCIWLLPPEQFVLAHDAATAGTPDALGLSAEAVSAARALARRRHGASFRTCRTAT